MARMIVESRTSGKTATGTSVECFRFVNARGTEMEWMTLGATMSRMRVKDREGRLGDVVFGFERFTDWLGPHPYYGATVGRFANRIANARFTLDGHEHALVANDGPHQLHGGPDGFSHRVWDAVETRLEGVPAVTFHLHSPDGDQGFPGAVDVDVTVALSEKDEILVVERAVTDRPTVVSLTQHPYFDLKDGGQSTENAALAHRLEIAADRYTPVDATLIPSGPALDVAGTRFDFRKRRPIGAGGPSGSGDYDHNFVLNARAANRPAARLFEPDSGRALAIFTTKPGLQLYTCNPRGICLEPQFFPDSPNRPDFPSAVLRPDEEYRHRTVFAFSIGVDA